MSDSTQLDIAEVVRRSGLPVSTLHVWEKQGLIEPSGRRGLRRQYDPGVLEQLAVIVLYQRGGFSLGEIAELLRPEAIADRRARFARKLEELRDRHRELAAAISGLEHALACPEPSPMVCPQFQVILGDVLPVSDE